MSEHEDKHHIVPFRTFLIVLGALLVLTFISIAVTNYELGPFTVVAALLLASIKSVLVLVYFMHLKFDVKMFGILVAAVLILIGVVIFITFLDYLYR